MYVCMTLLVSDPRLLTKTHACKPKADIISMQCQEVNRMITSHTYYSVCIPSKHKKSCTGSKYVTTRPFFCTAISQQLLHGRVAQPCGSNPYFGRALTGGIQWLKGMCSNGLAGIKVDVLMSDDICQPLFVYQALPRKAVPTTPVEPAAPSNEDTPPGEGLDADPQKTCQTVKAHAAHPAGVSTNASPTRALALQACSKMGFMASMKLKCIGWSYRGQVRQASWFKFPVPCLGQENKLFSLSSSM